MADPAVRTSRYALAVDAFVLASAAFGLLVLVELVILNATGLSQVQPPWWLEMLTGPVPPLASILVGGLAALRLHGAEVHLARGLLLMAVGVASLLLFWGALIGLIGVVGMASGLSPNEPGPVELTVFLIGLAVAFVAWPVVVAIGDLARRADPHRLAAVRLGALVLTAALVWLSGLLGGDPVATALFLLPSSAAGAIGTLAASLARTGDRRAGR